MKTFNISRIKHLINRSYLRLFQYLLNKNYYVPTLFMYGYDKIAWSSKENLQIAILGLKPNTLLRLAEKKLLWVFHDAVKTTPAIKDFYKKRGVDATVIRTINDFKTQVPQTTKENYILKYTLSERCIFGHLPKKGIIFKSAGVYGERTYWSQSVKEEDRFSIFVPFGLEYLFSYSKKNYNLINCWAFGTWPTAIDFTKAARDCGRMVNIGPNIDETIETIKKLGTGDPYLLSGYPPFLRNLVLEGDKRGVEWKNYNIDVLTGGEGFVEEWRSLLKHYLGDNSVIISAYGSTDKGLGEGIETPLTILIRNSLACFQLALTNEHHAQSELRRILQDRDFILPEKNSIIKLFLGLVKRDPVRDSRIPMFFQSDPLTYFHEEETNLKSGKSEVVTTNLKPYASQPVIKYNIQDESGIIIFDELVNLYRQLGIDVLKVSKKEPLPFPFFYVYGRSSGMISYYGENIYPEDVGRVIEYLSFAEKITSFKLGIEHDVIYIDLELKPNEEVGDYQGALSEMVQLLDEYSPGLSALSAKVPLQEHLSLVFHQNGTGPFYQSPSRNPYIVKYQYVGPRIFGHH